MSPFTGLTHCDLYVWRCAAQGHQPRGCRGCRRQSSGRGDGGGELRQCDSARVRKGNVVVEKEVSTDCQSSAGRRLSLFDRARPVGTGTPWDPERKKEEVTACLSQRLDLIFDSEHVAFECKSILIVPLSDRVKRNLLGMCMHVCMCVKGFSGQRHTHTENGELFRCII